MKIINLYAENLKRLSAVEITPEGNLVQITGRNGQGKTSVLDAIWWALEGSKNVQTTPIKSGEQKALIRLDLGKLVVTRRFNAQEDGSFTTSITVENDEGARFSSPQSMLDKMLGQLTFDPLAFTRMKPADQIHALRSLVPDFDFDAAEASVKVSYEARADCNRRVKQDSAAAAQIAQGLPEVRPEPVDVSDLSNQLQAAQEVNSEVQSKADRLARAKTSALAMAQRVDELRASLQAAEEDLSKANESIELLEGNIGEHVDTAGILEKIRNAAKTNEVADAFDRHDKLLEDVQTGKAASEKFTMAIDKEKEAMQRAIASAEIAIDGLSIEDSAVQLDGVPFEQASDAQQLQASIAIAMALNPTLKVIRVRDGSLLDDDAMKVLTDVAEASEYQIWIERVDNSGTIGFVLEDGAVKGQDLTPKAPAPDQTKAEGGEGVAQALTKASMFDADQN